MLTNDEVRDRGFELYDKLLYNIDESLRGPLKRSLIFSNAYLLSSIENYISMAFSIILSSNYMEIVEKIGETVITLENGSIKLIGLLIRLGTDTLFDEEDLIPSNLDILCLEVSFIVYDKDNKAILHGKVIYNYHEDTNNTSFEGVESPELKELTINSDFNFTEASKITREDIVRYRTMNNLLTKLLDEFISIIENIDGIIDRKVFIMNRGDNDEDD